jgi:transketolase
MRNAFLDELLALAGEDERVVLLTGDLGFMVLEPFIERYPDRFVNAGVAEQNMVGVATGLAEAGYRPFVYSIATFASMRPYEFLRDGPLLHGLPVRLVGVGGGFDYGHNGVTHYALEDVAIMRAQPRMGVIAPADPDQARAALRAAHQSDGPLYFRISKGGEALPGLHGRFELGRAETLRTGDDVALLAYGPIAGEAVRAADILEAEGISASVVVCASLAPAPVEDLVEVLGRVDTAVTVEAHYVTGGLGSLAAEIAVDHGLDVRIVRCGVLSMPSGATGSQAYLHEQHGLTAKQLATAARTALERRRLVDPA